MVLFKQKSKRYILFFYYLSFIVDVLLFFFFFSFQIVQQFVPISSSYFFSSHLRVFLLFFFFSFFVHSIYVGSICSGFPFDFSKKKKNELRADISHTLFPYCRGSTFFFFFFLCEWLVSRKSYGTYLHRRW